MDKWYWHIGLGWLVGYAIQALLPGETSVPKAVAGICTLLGAAAGEFLARRLLPRKMLLVGGPLLALLGALSFLLWQAVLRN